MALPPEPIDDLLPTADHVLLAEVVAVWDPATSAWVSEPAPGEPPPESAIGNVPRPIGAAPALPAQRVKLGVARVLRGAEATELEADKPAGAYLLLPGAKGPFLLGPGDPRPVILGRYGPDSYSAAQIEDALGRAADKT